MQKLIIEDIHCYAYHGCLKEETKIGGNFSVTVEMDLDLMKARTCDDLKETADYVLVHNIVRAEMAIPSKLIEHAAHRILIRLQKELPGVKKFILKVKKHNPPVNGQVGSATVILEG